MSLTLKNKKTLVTGASFIGIHLIKQLIKEKVASIRVVNLSSTKKPLIKSISTDIEFCTHDLRDVKAAQKDMKNIEIVFHLAADHGGRGYVDLFQANTSSNLLLDGSIFLASLKTNVEKIFFSSSACVYPNYLQRNIKDIKYLKENDMKTPYDADNMYGWAKLMGELTLKAYYKDYGLKSTIGRFFTVYGEHASESHAVMGTIAKAFIKQDPFEIWGNGHQIRNWTYVEDIVNGIIKLVKNVDDALPVNLGTTERITVNEMVQMVLTDTSFNPKKITHISMPTGPMNRVANISRAKTLLEWQPKFSFKEGLRKTINWYITNKNIHRIKKELDQLLIQS
jgi:UDP-glucose 4-epimerase